MSVIFYHDEQQKKLAEESLKSAQSENKSSITTQILPAETFYNAEDYHQKYMLRKHDWLIKVLKLDNESLITSSLAARINGYVGGYGDEVSNTGQLAKSGDTFSDITVMATMGGY